MQKRRDLFTRLGARLDIPREALPGSFGLTLSGERELTVRGCKRILSYESDVISLAVGRFTLFICGEELFCSSFGAGCVTVTGKISSLTLGEGKL